jgi:hypothetical protein
VPQSKGYRAEHIESKVREQVRSLILDPERLLEDIDRIIDEERSTVCGDPDVRLAIGSTPSRSPNVSGFQDIASEGLITLKELREKTKIPEEGHQLYQLLRLRVTADQDRNPTVEGMLGKFSVEDDTRTWVIATHLTFPLT